MLTLYFENCNEKDDYIDYTPIKPLISEYICKLFLKIETDFNNKKESNTRKSTKENNLLKEEKKQILTTSNASLSNISELPNINIVEDKNNFSVIKYVKGIEQEGYK